MQYLVKFDRIGRNKSPSELYVDTDNGFIEDQILDHVLPHLRSDDIAVSIKDDMSGGFIACGMRSGGTFSISEIGKR